MGQERWAAVDRYVEELLLPPDPGLQGALRRSEQEGLPAIQVAATHGALLHLLARSCGARRILEIGTLGGYSTIWLARALPPGGTLVSLESEQRHAAVARANVAEAGVDDVVEIRVGPALETLPGLAGPFDLAFVDADKPNNPAYFT